MSSEVKHVKIVGYADSTGDTKRNQKLSNLRAQAASDYLKAKGIYNTSVEDVRALGERNPSPKCQTLKVREERTACLRTDRRVEIEIEYIN